MSPKPTSDDLRDQTTNRQDTLGPANSVPTHHAAFHVRFVFLRGAFRRRIITIFVTTEHTILQNSFKHVRNHPKTQRGGTRFNRPWPQDKCSPRTATAEGPFQGARCPADFHEDCFVSSFGDGSIGFLAHPSVCTAGLWIGISARSRYHRPVRQSHFDYRR